MNPFARHFDVLKKVGNCRLFGDKLWSETAASRRFNRRYHRRLFSRDTIRCPETVPFHRIHSPSAKTRCSIYAVTGYVGLSVVILLDGSWEFSALKSAIVSASTCRHSFRSKSPLNPRLSYLQRNHRVKLPSSGGSYSMQIPTGRTKSFSALVHTRTDTRSIVSRFQNSLFYTHSCESTRSYKISRWDSHSIDKNSQMIEESGKFRTEL